MKTYQFKDKMPEIGQAIMINAEDFQVNYFVWDDKGYVINDEKKVFGLRLLDTWTPQEADGFIQSNPQPTLHASVVHWRPLLQAA